MWEPESIIGLEVEDKGTMVIKYENGDVERLTPSELTMNPLKRIPLFNILKSNSNLKPVVNKYLETFLGWKVEFRTQGNIDKQKEIEEWRRSLRVSKQHNIWTGVAGELEK